MRTLGSQWRNGLAELLLPLRYSSKRAGKKPKQELLGSWQLQTKNLIHFHIAEKKYLLNLIRDVT